MKGGHALVVQADALRLPLPDECVDLAIFSPPYHKLRRYDVEGIGNEDTPLEWLEALWAATAEVKRVLKSTGSIFVNLGDKYNGRSGENSNTGRHHAGWQDRRSSYAKEHLLTHGIREKSLLGLPGLYAAGCSGMLAAIGGPDPGLNLIWRRDQITHGTYIWEKRNHLPESVRDRTATAHEYVFHLVKSPRYYAAIDTLRRPWTGRPDSAPRSNGATTAGLGLGAWQPELAMGSSGWPDAPSAPTALPTSCSWDPSRQACNSTTCAATACASGPSTSSPLPCVRTCSEVRRLQQVTSPRPTAATGTPTTTPTPTGHPTAVACAECACERRTSAGTGERETLGSIPGSVWNIASDPLRLPAWLGVDHYAAFPPELPRRLILGWSPPGICCECGQGRWPVVDRGDVIASNGQELLGGEGRVYGGRATDGNAKRVRTKTGYSYPTRTATILGWACACTPSTLHPGTGESSGPDKRYGDHLASNGYPNAGAGFQPSASGHGGLGDRPKVGPWREYHLDGWTPPPTRPAVILDPFGGTGTTALVARALGRTGLSFDLSFAYSRAARYRCFDSGEWQDIIARTTGRPVKPLPKHNPAQERLAL